MARMKVGVNDSGGSIVLEAVGDKAGGMTLTIDDFFDLIGGLVRAVNLAATSSGSLKYISDPLSITKDPSFIVTRKGEGCTLTIIRHPGSILAFELNSGLAFNLVKELTENMAFKKTQFDN